MTVRKLTWNHAARMGRMSGTRRVSKRHLNQQRAAIRVAWPKGHPRAKGTYAMSASGGDGRRLGDTTELPAQSPLTRTPSEPPHDPRNLFDKVGDAMGKVPMSVFTPLMFEVEFCVAMPIFGVAWRNALAGPFNIPTVDYHVLPAELWAMTPLVGIPLGMVLFGTDGLPKRMHPWVAEHVLDPLRCNVGENAARIVQGGLFFGMHPIIQEMFESEWVRSTLSFTAEMVKSIALYTVTGTMLGLSLDAFLPAAVGLAVFSNIGSQRINRIWGSLGKPAGRVMLANVGIFFAPHAISGLENVVRDIPELPTGLGWGAQAIIATLITAGVFVGTARDAARLKAREGAGRKYQ